MVTFPHAKINLGLNVVKKRTDGYHDIVTCFYPLSWTDALEILPSEKLNFTHSGLQIPGATDNNLCLRAYQLLKADFDLPLVNIHLHKVIPMGAGLGGGSADAAFTIKMLDSLFALSLTEKKMMAYAAKLGSDCPFLIQHRPLIASGTGNIFEEVDLNLKGYFLAVVHPKIHIDTRNAYQSLTPRFPDTQVQDILRLAPEQWPEKLKNDFETPIFKTEPGLQEIKAKLYSLGAVYASMSGSGSSMYGIFKTQQDIKGHFPKEYVIWEQEL